MAGMDHTILFYKNGELQRTELEILDERCKVIYDRDARLCRVIDIKTKEEFTNFEKYATSGEYYIEKNTYIKPVFLRKIVEKFLPKEKIATYEFYRYIGEDLLILQLRADNYNVLFVFSGEDTYVLLGGYGHHVNPYTHFYHRGYGEVFEKRMSIECYEWLCETILDDMTYWYNDDTLLPVLRKKLNFKTYWEMTDEEKNQYHNERC